MKKQMKCKKCYGLYQACQMAYEYLSGLPDDDVDTDRVKQSVTETVETAIDDYYRKQQP